jgi:rhodanese-related sulfurtransferase
MTRTISRDDLKARLDAGVPTTIVESLPQKYYDTGHLPGAIYLPHDQVRQLAAERLPDKDATIVTYCWSTECQTSRFLAQALITAGYRNVFEYVEGKRDWQEAGFELEQSQPA